MCKVIYLILEGDDDIRFFEKIISPLFLKNGFSIIPIKQSSKKRKDCGKFIQTIENMNDWDYLFAKDIDVFPCAGLRREHIMKELSGKIKAEKILIVAKVIESWYLAGVSDKTMRSLGVTPKNIKKIIRSTDDIDKSKFYEFFPPSKTQIEIMNTLLDNYNIEIAKKRNKSFDYFISRFFNRLIINSKPGTAI